jgi:periplasmic protein CpxP/Spy
MTSGFRRLLLNRYTVLAFIAGAGLSAGAVALAQGAGMSALHHGMMLSGDHVDHMLKHVYVEIDATEAQKAQIDPLVRQAVNDLAPLHAQAQSAQTQFFQALTQGTVDRNGLETAREAHIQLAEQASKRIVQLIGDVGSVLTPTQRQALASHLQKLHGMPGS